MKWLSRIHDAIAKCFGKRVYVLVREYGSYEPSEILAVTDSKMVAETWAAGSYQQFYEFRLEDFSKLRKM